MVITAEAIRQHGWTRALVVKEAPGYYTVLVDSKSFATAREARKFAKEQAESIAPACSKCKGTGRISIVAKEPAA